MSRNIFPPISILHNQQGDDHAEWFRPHIQLLLYTRDLETALKWIDHLMTSSYLISKTGWIWNALEF